MKNIISVIMAVHNNEDYLEKAIESILRQSFGNFEFIIVNDASSDDSEIIIKKFMTQDKRIKVINNAKRLGLTKSLNKALRLVGGEYIARMDADDICFPQRFESQINFFKKNPGVDFCGTAVILIDENDRKIGWKSHPLKHNDICKVVLSYCPFIHPTLIFRCSILKEVSGYNEKFPYAQDYELILRLLPGFKAANLQKPLLYYRVAEKESISYRNLKQQEWLALKARWLALTRYGYGRTKVWRLIKPVLSFLVPVGVKIPVYKKLFWR